MPTRKTSILFTILFALFVFSAPVLAQDIFITPERNKEIYHGSWIDLNKNGVKDVYEDPKASLNDRINDLLKQMTVEEKTVQMVTLYGYGRVAKDELPTADWKNAVWKDGLGNIDEHLNSVAFNPRAVTQYSWPPSKHARAINEAQRFFVEDTRLGIPVDFTNEGIRGLCHQGATSFPAQIGQASAWDRRLVNRIGRITGREARILGYTNVYSPVLDLARDPRWGRVVECYSEDPYLTSVLGKEMITGIQSERVASTAKHFAVHGVPKGGRDGVVRTDPEVTPREVNELHLKPFKTAVTEAGIMGLMSSYNDYDGVPITASHYFLTELLRDQWGFKGYVVSDSWAVGGLEGRHHIADNYKETVYLSVMAGLNVRTNFNPPDVFVTPLRELVKEGRIPMSVIDSRVSDVLRVKFMLGLFDSPYVADPAAADKIVGSKDSAEVSLQSSRESLVLLKNNGLLPLNVDSYKKILVAGPNAKAVNPMISRYGPSKINVITVYDGIKKLVGDKAEIIYSPGCDHYDDNWPENELYRMQPAPNQMKMIENAVAAAKGADLIIVAVGDDENSVGEEKSRTSLDLPGNQNDLVQQLYKTGKPMAVVLINGRPLTINWLQKYAPAILEAWFPSEFGGQAIAEALFGLYNPGGKLPVTFPKTVGQIPFNFPAKRSSQLDQPTKWLVGIDTLVNGALYPFGFGLSYTKFEYGDLAVTPSVADPASNIKVTFTLKNIGKYKGDEVAQLYISDVTSSVVTYEERLVGFERVTLEPGETKKIEMTILPENLTLFNMDMKEVVEPGVFKVYVGSSSTDVRLHGEFLIKSD
ncbi:MAG: glycoside hydrolase family 3 N-terminal domain-containing protein [bacterium]